MAKITAAHLVLSTTRVKEIFRRLAEKHWDWSLERTLKTAWKEDEMCDDGAKLVSAAHWIRAKERAGQSYEAWYKEEEKRVAALRNKKEAQEEYEGVITA